MAAIASPVKLSWAIILITKITILVISLTTPDLKSRSTTLASPTVGYDDTPSNALPLAYGQVNRRGLFNSCCCCCCLRWISEGGSRSQGAPLLPSRYIVPTSRAIPRQHLMGVAAEQSRSSPPESVRCIGQTTSVTHAWWLGSSPRSQLGGVLGSSVLGSGSPAVSRQCRHCKGQARASAPVFSFQIPSALTRPPDTIKRTQRKTLGPAGSN